MMEEMIAQTEANAVSQVLDIMLIVGQGGGTRHPAHVQIQLDATWDDLVQAWYHHAEALGIREHVRYPTVAGAYEFKTSKGKEVFNIADYCRIFACPTVPLLSPPPAPTAAPGIKLNVIYWHISDLRKYHRHGGEMTISSETTEQEIPTRWSAEVRTRLDLKEFLRKTAREMSLQPDAYEWTILRPESPINRPEVPSGTPDADGSQCHLLMDSPAQHFHMRGPVTRLAYRRATWEVLTSRF
jgi:hypothetical protein